MPVSILSEYSSWIQTFILCFTLLALVWQATKQEKAIMIQTKALQSEAYSRCLNDFSDTRRWLTTNKLNDDIYANVTNQIDRYKKWNTYSEVDMQIYSYFELVYDIIYRVFTVQKQGWISQEEWGIWVAWSNDLAKHPLFRDIYNDNLGLYNRDFENFMADRLKNINKN